MRIGNATRAAESLCMAQPTLSGHLRKLSDALGVRLFEQQGKRLVPTALQRVIQRCLEKNPQERFHSARDIAYALEAVSAVSDERPLLGQLPLVRPPKLTRRAAMVLGGTGLLGSYAAAIALGQRLRPVARCFSPRFRQLTFRRGVIENARFAADGNTVVYGAAWEQTLLSLYEVRTDQPQSRLLYSDAHVFALSGPGELAMVRFGSPELPTATLARAPLAGGAPRDVLTGVHAADWSPWQARERLRARWPGLRFTLRPDHGPETDSPSPTPPDRGQRRGPA